MATKLKKYVWLFRQIHAFIEIALHCAHRHMYTMDIMFYTNLI